MSTEILPAGDLRRVPWRNGQGTTTEIAADGPGDELIWRVSLADVGRSGDFSLFPGIDRTIVLVQGAGRVLHLPAETHVLIPDEPFAFDGGLPVRCTVEAPTRDLNLMTRRGAAEGGLAVAALDAAGPPLVVPGAEVLVVLVLEGSCTLDGAELGAGDAAVLKGAAAARLAGSGRVAVARIDPA
jgi:uncharacterized protein